MSVILTLESTVEHKVYGKRWYMVRVKHNIGGGDSIWKRRWDSPFTLKYLKKKVNLITYLIYLKY